MRPATITPTAHNPADPSGTDDLRIQQVETKIAYLKNQIDSLEAGLPETHQYLMDQLDQQRVLLESLNLKQAFHCIDQQELF
jgi:hypothetical protein